MKVMPVKILVLFLWKFLMVLLSCFRLQQWAVQDHNLHSQWIIQMLSIWGTSINTSVGVLHFFPFLCPPACLCVIQSLCLCISLELISSFEKLITIDLLNFLSEPCFRARIKNVQSAYGNGQEFVQKIMVEALVSGFGTKQALQPCKLFSLL